jgi:hypothetical protein
VRRGATKAPARVYPAVSVGEGYQRAVALRAQERAAKGIVWTKEQHSRDDWPRAWKWLEPIFGDVDPKTIQPEHLLTLRTKVAARVSSGEAHRVIKVWRALWKKMAVLKFCDKDADPSMLFGNASPMPRQDIWEHQEVLRLVQRAWRRGYKGLAAIMAVGWDSMLSPVDTRSLTPGQQAREYAGAIFFLDRAKTGRAAAGTLTKWSEAILRAYMASRGTDLHPDAPIFCNRSGGLYTKDTLGDDFREIRSEVLGREERRTLADMRRSGAVEGSAGGASPSDTSNKMANSLIVSTRLQKTYTPVNVTSVRRFDEARVKARERKPDKSVIGRNEKVS